MNFPELIFGVLLVVALVGLAGYFAGRQLRTRKTLMASAELTADERGFVIRQTRRRILCCVLMVLFAVFLVGWFFIESNLPALKDAADAPQPGQAHPLVHLIAYYWIFALFVLFGIIALAGLDFFATARYGLRQKKQLDSERRAVLEAEVKRLRQEHQGRNGGLLD